MQRMYFRQQNNEVCTPTIPLVNLRQIKKPYHKTIGLIAVVYRDESIGPIGTAVLIKGCVITAAHVVYKKDYQTLRFYPRRYRQQQNNRYYSFSRQFFIHKQFIQCRQAEAGVQQAQRSSSSQNVQSQIEKMNQRDFLDLFKKYQHDYAIAKINEPTSCYSNGIKLSIERFTRQKLKDQKLCLKLCGFPRNSTQQRGDKLKLVDSPQEIFFKRDGKPRQLHFAQKFRGLQKFFYFYEGDLQNGLSGAPLSILKQGSQQIVEIIGIHLSMLSVQKNQVLKINIARKITQKILYKIEEFQNSKDRNQLYVHFKKTKPINKIILPKNKDFKIKIKMMHYGEKSTNTFEICRFNKQKNRLTSTFRFKCDSKQKSGSLKSYLYYYNDLNQKSIKKKLIKVKKDSRLFIDQNQTLMINALVEDNSQKIQFVIGNPERINFQQKVFKMSKMKQEQELYFQVQLESSDDEFCLQMNRDEDEDQQIIALNKWNKGKFIGQTNIYL